MRILFVTHYSELYGANLSMLDLIDHLRSIHTVFVLMPRRGSLEDELLFRDVRYFIVPYKKWVYEHSTAMSYFKTTKNLIKLLLNYLLAKIMVVRIRRLEINIIHSNSSVINFGGLLSRLGGYKHVWHIREFGFEDYNLKYIKGLNKSAEFIALNSSKVICISQSIKAKYQGLINENKLTLIYNGVRSDKIPVKNTFITENVSLLISGLIMKGKGQEDAIRAVAKLYHRGIQNLSLSIAGGSVDQEYLENLKSITSREQIGHLVEFLGFQKDFYKRISNYDIGLVCSTKEAFGRVTVEYMFAKLAIVGANSGATPELLGDTGLLYELNNIDELADRLELLISSSDIRKQLGEKAYTRAKNHFEMDRTIKEVTDLYAGIIDNP